MAFVPIVPTIDKDKPAIRRLDSANILDRSIKPVAQRGVQGDIPTQEVQVRVPPGMLALLVGNLLQNAVKFSPPDKPITIRAWIEESAITVSVRDEGIGIDPAHHDMIFEEFRQVDASVRREFGGTGLGLAIVKRIMRDHRGDIIAEVETDKGLIEIECFETGVVEKILIEPGTKVPVGAVMAVIATVGATAATAAPAAPAPPPPPPPPPPLHTPEPLRCHQ
jgi:hypothetical protein